jgi:hypothetical protein
MRGRATSEGLGGSGDPVGTLPRCSSEGTQATLVFLSCLSSPLQCNEGLNGLSESGLGQPPMSAEHCDLGQVLSLEGLLSSSVKWEGALTPPRCWQLE